MVFDTAQVKQRKARKVSAVFKRADKSQHCGGINALAVSSDGKLFTASKDSTVKRWEVSGEEPRLEVSFEGHSDWVNSIALLEDVLVSCSSDTTVQFWRQEVSSDPEFGFNQHTDYVTCLAAAKTRPVVVSAGLRGEVLLWDVQKAMRSSDQSVYGAKPCEGHSGSVYAVALNPQGSLLAAGSTDGTIRISDTRSQAVLFSLKGHTENVRTLLMSEDGTLLLSGSSDHTMRLWDLGQQRSVQTLAVHTDSVWSLLASPDFSVVYSGGRDHTVYRTQLSNRTSELVLREADPVTGMVLDPQSSALWVSTTASSINRWNVNRALPQVAALARPSMDLQQTGSLKSHTDGRTFLVGSSAQARARQNLDGLKPQQSQSTAQSSGIAPLVQSATLTDRRHILTKDADGNVELWDVATGSVEQRFGKVDFQEKEAELFQPQSAPAWFTWDTKLGSLTLHLEHPIVFAAEVYAQAMGVEGPVDHKLNCGEELLRGLFAKWLDGLQQLHAAEQQPAANGQPGSQQQTSQSDRHSHSRAPGEPQEAASQRPFQYKGRRPPPVILCSFRSPGQAWDQLPWQAAADKLTGREDGRMIPSWLSDALLQGRLPNCKESKAGFHLMPAQGSGLPSLLQSQLTAPRILPVHKLYTYAQSKLAEHQIHFQLAPIYWHKGKQQEDARSRKQGDVLELTCNGMALPFDLSIGAVRAYIWKRSDDPIVHYGKLNSSRPAPLPVLGPVS